MPAEKGIFLDVLPRFDMAAMALILDKVTAMFKKTGAAMGATFGAEAETKIRRLSEEVVRANNVVTDSEIRAERAVHAHEVARLRLNEITAAGTARASTLARATYAVADADRLATARSRDLAAARALQAKAEEAHANALAGSAIAAGNLGKVLNVGGMAATGGFLFAMAESGKAAGNFEERLTRLVASAGESASNLATVSQGLMGVASQTGYSANELADGMYLVEKAGYRGSEGIKIMTAAAQLARAENTSLEEVIQGLTTTMHDFHIPTDQAATVASKLNIAVGEAKTNLREFSGALATVEPTASLAKMRLEEVYAAMAQVTQSGITAERASQNLNNTLEHLINIPMTQRTAMNKFGIDPDELKKGLGDPNVGLVGVLDTVQAKIRDHLTPEGQVWVDTYFQSASAVAALNRELSAIKENPNVSDSAKQLAEGLVKGTVSQKTFTADRKKEIPATNALLTQFETGYKKSQGFSDNLKKQKSQEETVAEAYKEVFGTDAAFRVTAQLAGTEELLDEYAKKVLQLKLTTAEADGTVHGFNVTQETLNAKLRDAKAAFGNVAIQLGNAFLPALKVVADALAWVARELYKHPGIMQTIAIALGALTTAWLTWKAVLVGRWFIDALGTMVTWFGTLQARVALTISEMQGIVPAMATSEAAVATSTTAMDVQIGTVGATSVTTAAEVGGIGEAAVVAEGEVAVATTAMEGQIATVGSTAAAAAAEISAMGAAAGAAGASAAYAIGQFGLLQALPLAGVGAIPDTSDPEKLLSGDALKSYNDAVKRGDSEAAARIFTENTDMGLLGPKPKAGAQGDEARGKAEQQQALADLQARMLPENPFTKAEIGAILLHGLGGLSEDEAIKEARKRYPVNAYNPGLTPTPEESIMPRPDPGALIPSDDESKKKKKSKSGKDLPEGTKDDPVYTLPIPQAGLSGPKGSSGGGSGGGQGDGTTDNIGYSYDPFKEAGQGGFTLPNIARLMATFFANMAFGNPYGRLQAGKEAAKEAAKRKGESASDPLYVQQVGIPTGDGGFIQVTKSQLDMINASARESAAATRYQNMVDKYGSDSSQARNAAYQLLKAKEAKRLLGIKQSGDASDYLDESLLDGLGGGSDGEGSDDAPLAAESGYEPPSSGGGMRGFINRAIARSRGRGSRFSSGLETQAMLKSTDNYLLSNVPSGRYAQTQAADLTKGLADCSSAVEDLVNLMDGRPTSGRSMSTGNASQWLMSRGFLPGTSPGAFNVGFNSHHMQATLPGGTPFNWGSDSAAARGGVGGTGAFDPSFTSHFYRPVLPMNAGTYDTGGILPPGPTLVQNDTGKPEVVLNPEQQKTLSDKGVDPQSLLHGTAEGAPPGPPGPENGGEQPKVDIQPAPLGPKPMDDPSKGVAKDGSRPYTGGSGPGFGISGGIMGTIESAVSSAVAMAVNSQAPGAGSAAGAAADIATQELNRAVGFVGQLAGIGVQGLLETFGLNDSPIADPSKSWFGKIAGGIAGAHPSTPNSAGETAAPLKPKEEDQKQQPQQQGASPLVVIENMHNNGADGQQVGNDIARRMMATSPNNW